LKSYVLKFLVFILFVNVNWVLFSTESEAIKAVQAHIRIKDYPSAHEEAVEALHQYPHSKGLWEAYIKVLAKQGQEKEMISVWKDYVEVFPEAKENRELTETLAWGIIDHASHSSSPLIRVLALISAVLSQDAKGIQILQQNLRDNNSAIRGIAAQLSGQVRDDDIKDEIYRLFQKETVWNVRLEVIRSMGGMKIKRAQNELLALLQNSKTTAEETAAIITTLVDMWDSVTRDEVVRLAQSNRAGLRLLACQVVAHFDMKEDLDLIAPLLDDHNADVRKAALWTVGYLRVKQLKGLPVAIFAEKKLQDIDPLVGIKAAWLLTLNDAAKGQAAFIPWFQHPDRDVRIMAAAHLAACGKYASPLIIDMFKSSSEPYVRMNLALGLIGQRLEPQLACMALYQGLQTVKERWTWDENNQVRALIPSKLRHLDDLNNSPETVDQVTRLEILNILAVMKFPYAQMAIKSFSQEKTWGITAMAAATLLTEGDEAALDLVQNLMNDSDMQVRIQAALILALWGGGEESLDTLSKAYPQVDREMKERILEGIVKIASSKSIPFLLDRLQEPHQSLRLMAAAGLIQCLYH
jgi:HEAT repeat protein